MKEWMDVSHLGAWKYCMYEWMSLKPETGEVCTVGRSGYRSREHGGRYCMFVWMPPICKCRSTPTVCRNCCR